MYWILQCGHWGKEAKNCSTHKKPFISLLRRFDKGREHLWLYLPLQPTAIVLQDRIYKWRKQLFSTSDMISCRKGKVSLHDFPKKGHSTMSHIPWMNSLYVQEQILPYWPLRRYNLWCKLYKSYPGNFSTEQFHARILLQYRCIWWHWYNSLTPRHRTVVKEHGQKCERWSEPISSGYLGHTLNSALFLGQEGVCLKSTERDGKHWMGLYDILQQNSCGATASPELCFSYSTPRSYFQMLINWLVPWGAEG